MTDIYVFIALIVLTILTTGLAWIDMGVMNLPVALLIAGMKASLVVLFFMHVRRSKVLVKVVAVGSLFWLGVLMVLSLNDYISRIWIQNPSFWH